MQFWTCFITLVGSLRLASWVSVILVLRIWKSKLFVFSVNWDFSLLSKDKSVFKLWAARTAIWVFAFLASVPITAL